MQTYHAKPNRWNYDHHDDAGVSPVIAVILMVAITVVLAAVVYVWVAGFSEPGNAPPGTLSLTTGPEDAGNVRDLIVVSASPSLTYGDLRMSLDGETFTLATVAAGDGEWNALRGSSTFLDDLASVRAGDTIRLDAATTTEGKTLRVAQASANTVLVTMRLN